jgi:hypothetical protein
MNTCIKTALVVFGFMFAMTAMPVVAQDSPKPKPPAELAPLLKEIEAKEKELAALRKKAEELRRLSPGVVSIEGLFRNVPENAHPKDPTDAIRFNRANDWLEKTAPGKIIELSYEVKTVELRRGQDKRYRVEINSNRVFTPPPNPQPFPTSFSDWPLRVCPNTGGSFDQLVYLSTDESTAEKLSNLKGKTVLVRAKVVSAKIEREGNRTVMYAGISIDGIKP